MTFVFMNNEKLFFVHRMHLCPTIQMCFQGILRVTFCSVKDRLWVDTSPIRLVSLPWMSKVITWLLLALLFLFLVRIFVSLDVFSCVQHAFICFYMKMVDELVTLCSDAQTGSLRTLRQEGSLYDPGKDTSAVTWYVCTFMCSIHPSIHLLMLENH